MMSHLLLLCVSTFSASGSAGQGYSQPEKIQHRKHWQWELSWPSISKLLHGSNVNGDIIFGIFLTSCPQAIESPSASLSERDAALLNSLLVMETIHRQQKWQHRSNGKFLAALLKGHQLDHTSALANNSAIRAPRINVGQQTFAGIIDAALSQKLSPKFDAFGNAESVLLASSVLSPLVSSLAEAMLPWLESEAARTMAAGTLRALSSENEAIKMVLHMKGKRVDPLSLTVGTLSGKIGDLHTRLGELSNAVRDP